MTEIKKNIGFARILKKVFLSLVLTACVASGEQSASGIEISQIASLNASTVSGLGYTAEIDKSTIMTFEISADPDEWQNMLDNAINEEYIPADITINGMIIKNVGIRPKGNSSLSSVANDPNSDRYSFKIKFDEYVNNQTWLGLDKIVLNGNFSDATSMKEYLSYDILSYIGVDAPLFAYADIKVNGENWGFYLAVEDIDSVYRDRVKNGEGELYKPDSAEMGNIGNFGGGDFEQMREMFESGTQNMPPQMGFNADGAGNQGWPGNESNQGDFNPPEDMGNQGGFIMPGNEGNPEDFATPENSGDMGVFYFPDMESFTGEFPNFGDMERGGGMGMTADNGVALIYTTDNEEDYSSIFDNAETKTDSKDHQRVIEALKNLNAGTNLEEYVDVDAVLRYLAAHTIVVNLDSYSGSLGHNYYLYENDGMISILPWDYNMAFGGFQSGNASDVVNFPIDTPVSGVSMENRPLISKLLEVPEYLERYHGYLQEIIDGYFTNGKFEQTVDALDSMISAYIANDTTGFSTYEEYRTAIVELKKLGTLRALSISGQLNGSIPSTTEGQKAEPEKLIDASSVNMSALSNSNMGRGREPGERGDRQEGFPGGRQGNR